MQKIYRKIIAILAAPLYLSHFFQPEVGAPYGLGFWEKLGLLRRFRKNSRNILTASNWLEHVQLAVEILSIPPEVKGDVIECGCYKGGSTANLSLVCARVKRRLIVCDSFEGLPDTEDRDKIHYNYIQQRKEHYEKGQFCGRLEEVKENIRRFGDVGVCEFVQGYFCDTLPKMNGGRYVTAFLDVDLHTSLEDCLVSLWPRMQPGSRVYSHEAQDIQYVALFYDNAWWKKNLNEAAPGFVGAGTGLPLNVAGGSGLGYAVKMDPDTAAKGFKLVNFSAT